MSTDIHLEISRGPPFWWEVYRGDDPQWVERSMFGYLIEKEAKQRNAIGTLDNVALDGERQRLVARNTVDHGGDFALPEPIEG
jgi:hypothetical protein